MPVTIAIALVYTLGLYNYYTCTIKLAPENAESRSSNVITSLTGGMGQNFDVFASSKDAITPSIYSDVIKSTNFRYSLSKVKIRRSDDNREMSYFDYLLYEQKYPWWSRLKSSLMGMFSKKKASHHQPAVDLFKLTSIQSGVLGKIRSNTSCTVDKKTSVITISVLDQDPLVCAIIADSLRAKLQNCITDYRTSKARVDFEYYQKLSVQAKEKYDKARDAYARFYDANRDVIMEFSIQEQERLENEMQMNYESYSQIQSQLINAEAQIQQATPAFTTLRSATVPVVKEGPKRGQLCILIFVIGFIVSSLWILYQEKRLKLLLGIY